MRRAVFAAVGIYMALMYSAEAKCFDIVSRGASQDAAPSANAKAIQLALDDAANAGGGRVVIPKGVWMSGTLRLRSNTELHLEEGAVLKASGDLADYNEPDEYPQNCGCPSEQWNAKHFIIAHEVHDVAITGKGVLDGNSGVFFEETPFHADWTSIAWIKGARGAKDKVNLRPGQMVVFIESRNLRVEGITIRNSTCWSLFFYGCDDVVVRDYTVRNGPCDLNTDGVDIDCCSNVLVEHADIDTGDDAVAIRASQRHLRGGKKKACENIRVKDCTLAAYAMGIRIGVGEGLIRNVDISNCRINRGAWGISFCCWYGKKEVNGVDIEDVRIADCEFNDCYENWRIRIGGDKQEFGVRRIQFKNCAFHGQKPGMIDYAGNRVPQDISFDGCKWSPLSTGLYVECARRPTNVQQ